MRSSIPSFNQLVNPLHDLLEDIYKIAKKRTKASVKKINIADVGWKEEHMNCWESCKKQLQNLVTLAHPDDTKEICVFADASNDFWGALITQISSEHMERLIENQHHEPLLFLSGKFTGAAESWPIIEKKLLPSYRRVKKQIIC